jgi:hypothetical protein
MTGGGRWVLAGHSTASHRRAVPAEDHPRCPTTPNVSDYNVTNSDYALGFLRYSIRARAIP